MNLWARLLSGSLAGLTLVLAAVRGGGVPFADQWPLFEALRNTAAIVFAVVGAWLAIVYPERLKWGLNNSSQTGDLASARRVAKLLIPVVHSTLILGVVLLVGLFAPLVRDFSFVREHLEVCRALSYLLLSTLTMLQVWTVILTLIPASEVRTGVLDEAVTKETVDAVFSGTRVGPPRK